MILIAIAVVVGLLAGALYATWLAHETAKAEAQRQRLERVMQASEPRPWSSPAAKGWKRKVS